MSQEYQVSFFKAGDFQDNFGNFWCEAAFEGVSEPVRWVVKDPSKIKVGDVVYGHIEDATSKAGRPYNRFKTDKREDSPQPYKSQPQGSYVAHNDDKEDSIARAVALKAAVEYAVGFKLDDVLPVAELYFAWLKNENSGRQQAVVPTPTPETSNAVPSTPAATTGYQKFQEARSKVNQDPEVQSLMDFAEQHNGGDHDN